MALSSSPPPSVFAYKSASPSSPHTHQFPAATQLRPSLIKRRAIYCPPVRVTAFHTCPDTSSPTTLYHVLQLPQTATQTDIKAAYRRLALLYHLDARRTAVVEKGEEEDKEARTKLFLQIHSAYATLSDAQSRARYDLQLSTQALQDRIATPLSAGNSYSSQRSSAAFTPYRVGRSWETDQCWC